MDHEIMIYHHGHRYFFGVNQKIDPMISHDYEMILLSHDIPCLMVIENDDIHSFWSGCLIPTWSIGSTQARFPHLSAPTALGISVASKLLKALI
jgi:hypothetical protein